MCFRHKMFRRSLVEKTHTFPCGCSWFPRERWEEQEKQQMGNMVTNGTEEFKVRISSHFLLE